MLDLLCYSCIRKRHPRSRSTLGTLLVPGDQHRTRRPSVGPFQATLNAAGDGGVFLQFGLFPSIDKHKYIVGADAHDDEQRDKI